MIKIKVEYFLSQEGVKFFEVWYNELIKVTSQQNGFVCMSYLFNKNNPVVYLDFESMETLNFWKEKPEHHMLSQVITSYYIQSPKVEIEILDAIH